ncbi:MAG: hypothetical protein R3B40_21805 [Polyangiales bacterium]
MPRASAAGRHRAAWRPPAVALATNGSWRRWALLVLSVAALGPSEAAAQPTPYPETQPFVNASGSAPGRRPGQGLDLSASLFTGVAAGGSERTTLATPALENSLAPAFVLGARLELSTSRYIAFGGFFDYARTEVLIVREPPEEDFGTRTGMLGFGLFMKLQAPFGVAGRDANVYVSVPFGMGVLRPPAAAASDPAFGVVFGALAGVHVKVSDHLGGFVEAGLRASRFSDISRSYRQACAHAGIAYAF